MPLRASALGQSQPRVERDERSGECAAHPHEDARALNDVLPDPRREQPLAAEDDEGEQHEDRAELEHGGDPVRVIGADELRQEGEEEDQQLRVGRDDAPAATRESPAVIV